MKPVNSKSLFHHLCNQMEMLDRDEIDVSKASTQAKLVGQCVNLLNYELKRCFLMNQLTSTNAQDKVREIESKNFDSLN